MTVQIVNIGKNKLPEYAHKGDAGIDLMADFSHPELIKAHDADWDSVNNYFVLFSGGRAAIPTGIKVKIPNGYEMQVRGRSGLAINSGIFAHVGTIDSNYTGEICVIITNLSGEPFYIEQGDRIGQAILNKVGIIDFEQVTALDTTNRGESGFGSTGVSSL